MKIFKWIGGLILAVVLAGAAYLLAWPIPFDPERREPLPNRVALGTWTGLTNAPAGERMLEGTGNGPEAITAGPDGRLYTGYVDGRIVAFDPQTGDSEAFADVGGRPLGLEFNPEGDLIVANAILGLQSVAPDRTVTLLSDSVDGTKILFADDLDISSDGTVWFSDASMRYPLDAFMMTLWSGERTGRLLKYDPSTGETSVVLEGLGFANGVALGPDEDYVLVNETTAYRVIRYWIRGPKAGTSDVMAEGLPAFIDNITHDAARNLFWIAMPAPRDTTIDKLHARPFLKTIAYRMSLLFGAPEAEEKAWVSALRPDGSVAVHYDATDQGMAQVTSALAHEGHLWLGTLEGPAVLRIPLPDDLN